MIILIKFILKNTKYPHNLIIFNNFNIIITSIYIMNKILLYFIIKNIKNNV